MKLGIWKQIQSQIEKCKQQGKCPADLDASIVEINLSMGNNDMIEEQLKIQQLLDKIEEDHADLLHA